MFFVYNYIFLQTFDIFNIFFTKMDCYSLSLSRDIEVYDPVVSFVTGLELEANSTISTCWLGLLIWSLLPTPHFFLLLIVFEVIFAGIAIEFITTAATIFNLDGMVMSLSILTFAALDSIVGLSYLVFINKTCNVNSLNVSFC